MRVYLPSTIPLLAAALKENEIGSPPLCAFAVTPALREWYASGDVEELEYAAMTAAARVSLRLLAADSEAPRRRVVLAAEIPDEVVVRNGDADDRPDRPDRAAVRVTTGVPMAKVVSAHIDDPVAAADVRAAVAALPAADEGDEDARFIVDGAEGHELLWYAASELPHLYA
jgi:Family of unknown function (DUF6912)